MATRPPIDFAEPVEDLGGLTPYQAPPRETGFMENLSASRREMEIVGNTNAQTVQMDEAYRPIIEALEQSGARWGPNRLHFLNPSSLAGTPGAAYNMAIPSRDEMERMVWEEIGRQRRANPGFLQGVPDTPQAFRQQVTQRYSAELQRIRQTQSGSTFMGTVGQFVGGVAGSFEDPVNIWTMPIGGESTTLFRAIGRAAIENMVVETISQPFAMGNYAELGEQMGLSDALRNILFAGGAGAAFRGGAEGIGAGIRGAGPAYDRLVEGLFSVLPEPLQRRWADSATVDDRLLIDILRSAVPESNWTPEVRSAVNVVEREVEIQDASPFEAGGGDVHASEMTTALRRIIDSTPRTPEAVPEIQLRPERNLPAPASAPGFERQWSAIIGNEGGTGRHGEFLTSPAGAIGPAQVMPGTAPEAAALAGLPWDDHRYRTDPQYNTALGRAYYQEMLRIFRNPDMAAAAYNAGPGSARRGTGMRGALERARRAGEPDNWEHYLPRETQQYVRDFRRRSGMAPGERVEMAQAAPVAEPETRVEVVEQGPVFAERETVEPDIIPLLRRDMFGSDDEWLSAQRTLYRQRTDFELNEQTVADAIQRGEGRGGETPFDREVEEFAARHREQVEAVLRQRATALALEPAPERGQPASLIDFIQRRGGVEDVTGELAAIGLGPQRGIAQRGQRKIIRARSANARRGIAESSEHAPDRVFQAAVEAGYFPDIKAEIDSGAQLTKSLSAFYEAIDEEVRGRPRHTLADQPLVEARRAAEANPRLRNLMDEIASAADEAWGVKLDHTDDLLERAAAIYRSSDFEGSMTEAWDLAGDQLYNEVTAAALAETGNPAYRGGDAARFEPEGFDTGEDLGRSGGEPGDAGEGGAAAPNAQERAALDGLEPFDDPSGEGIRAAADSLEHDILRDIEADPTLRGKRFLIEGVGEQTLDEILDDLNADKAAAAALRGCL